MASNLAPPAIPRYVKRSELLGHRTMTLMSALVFHSLAPLRVAWSILDCARRTSTFPSCAFREQEDDQATLPALFQHSHWQGNAETKLKNYFGPWEIQGWGASWTAPAEPAGCSKRPSSKAAADESTGSVASGLR